MKHIGKTVVSFMVMTVLFVFTGMATVRAEDCSLPITPDFAYPQTVSENASCVLKNALAKGDDETAVKAIVMLVICGSEINRDEVQTSIDMMEDALQKLSEPWKNLVYLLEAKVYTEIYSSDEYAVNMRELPENYVHKSVFEWDAPKFRNTVAGLIENALSNREALIDTPLADIKGILEDYSEYGEEIFPSVYDFIANNALDVISNFNSKLDDYRNKILDGLIAKHTADGNLASLAYFKLRKADSLGYSERNGYLENILPEFGNSPWEMMIFNSISPDNDNLESERTYYAKGKELVERWPDFLYTNALRNKLANLSAESVLLSTSTQYLSTQPIVVEIDNSNCPKFEVRLYRIDDPSILKNGMVNIQVLFKSGKPVSVSTQSASDELIFNNRSKMSFPNPGYGRYAVVAVDADGKLNNPNRLINTFIVSDLSLISISDNLPEDVAGIYVVSAIDNSPVYGGSVEIMPNGRNNEENRLKRTVSDENGFVKGISGNNNVVVKNGKDILYSNIYAYHQKPEAPRKYTNTSIFTDLGIYHPGDTVQFSVVGYTQQGRVLAPAAEESFKVILRNANYTDIDTLTLKTDAYGRVAGKFILPKEGMLGNFSIYASAETDYSYLGSANFQVADYKAPSFYVNLEAVKNEDADGEATIKGVVKTYSGIALGGSSITYTLTSGGLNNYNVVTDTITADADGNFEIRIAPEKRSGLGRIYYYRTLEVSATAPYGETVQAPKLCIPVGGACEIKTSIEAQTEVSGKDVIFKVSAVDWFGNPVKDEIAYTITRLGDSGEEQVCKGIFASPELIVPASLLPSAKYRMDYTLMSDTLIKSSCTTIIYRITDTSTPEGVMLWTPAKRIVAKSGEKSIELPLGSTYDGSYILVNIFTDNRLVETRWVKVGKRMQTVKVPVVENEGIVNVALAAGHNLENETVVVQIVPEKLMETFDVEIETFRDKIVPGDKETWKFRFVHSLGQTGVTPVLGVMSDKSLNAIAPFKWSFRPSAGYYYSPFSLNYSPYVGWSGETFLFSNYDYLPVESLEVPIFNLYGMPLYANRYTANVFYASTKESKRTMRSASAKVETAVVAEDAVAGEAEDSGDDLSGEEFRPVEMPLAFFCPDLQTDENGVLDLSFTVPDYNTTWQLQVLGYDENMRTAYILKDAVASKPIMIRSHVPSYLTAGDRVKIPFTLMNNYDENLEIGANVEFFNVETGEVIENKSFVPQKVAANSSVDVYCDFFANPDFALIGVRCIALSGNRKDGEQTQIAILPAVAMVRTTQPVYMSVGENSCEVEVPENISKNAKVDFTWCDNPIWLAVSSLPSISLPNPDNSVLSIAKSLYGNALSEYVVEKYPLIGDALKQWTATQDPALVSRFVKNEDLKTIEIQNTIWQPTADSETLRLASLCELLDNERVENAIGATVDELAKRQNVDGGWCWIPGSDSSSEWITESVLSMLAPLARIDAMPADSRFKSLISKAVAYTDKCLIDNIDTKIIPSLSSLVEYFYVRDSFAWVKTDAKIKKIKADMLSKLKKDWKSLSLEHLPKAAIILNENGESKEVGKVLESLAQRAYVSEDGTAGYANLSGRNLGLSPLIITANALQAFNLDKERLTDYQKNIYEGLQRWLLLQWQTREPSQAYYAPEVIYTLLSTTDAPLSTGIRRAIVISNGEKDIDLTLSPYCGLTSTSINPEIFVGAPDGQILITRVSDTSIAWGGLMESEIKPLDEINEIELPEMSISRLYVAPDNKTEIKVGDRVRVTLILKLTRDMEFVNITDPRPAGFLPIDQTAGYTSSDGLWYYREPRESSTNIMVSSLPKGTYVINYEVFADCSGTFSAAPATAQSLLDPLLYTASRPAEITVAGK